MKVTWLGQSGYLFQTGNKRLLVDPFLSNISEVRPDLERLVECPLAMDELKPDYIFITHNHIDHFDPIALPEIHHKYPHALICGPESVMQKAKALNFDSSVLVSLNNGETKTFGNFEITATPAFHTDPYSVGFLIKAEEKTLYITGDSLFNDELSERINQLAQYKIDVMFVCINGKLGNMTWQEALILVKQLQPKIAIPMHYGMFAENTVNPSMFLEGCKKNNINPLELFLGVQVEI